MRRRKNVPNRFLYSSVIKILNLLSRQNYGYAKDIKQKSFKNVLIKNRFFFTWTEKNFNNIAFKFKQVYSISNQSFSDTSVYKAYFLLWHWESLAKR